MRRNFTCVAINLDDRPVRWRTLQRVARLHRLTVRRFPARDGARGRAPRPLVRASKRADLVAWMGQPDVPLDKAVIRVGQAHPGAGLRSRRNLAWQAPFASDIDKQWAVPAVSRAAG